jgi:hypothetical protein
MRTCPQRLLLGVVVVPSAAVAARQRQPEQLNMRFYARADKQVNQKTAPVTPFGWGESTLAALRECKKLIQDIHRSPGAAPTESFGSLADKLRDALKDHS